MKKLFFAIIILCILGSSIYYLEEKSLQKGVVVEKPAGDVINSVIFACKDSKTIHAIFFKDKVELTLSDTRTMLLMQAISASGVRYANSDESFVFWNKGNTAFVNEGNKVTFQDCVITTK